jgi:SAM-dependent methyltransferase
MQFVFPNYGAFFEGHYALPWIPYMGRRLGKLWVRLWGREPSYVGTLQLTNYYKTRRWLKPHREIEVVSYGEEIFRERMLGQRIRDWAGLGTVRRWVDSARRLHVVGPLTRLLLWVGSFDPIVLSAVRRRDEGVPPPPDNLSIYEMRWSDWTDMKAFGPSSRWLRHLIGDHLHRLPAAYLPARVLDLGCGEGSTTAYLAAELKPAEVLGIDRSEAGIQCARERYSGANLRFARQDDTAALAAGSFDLVTCFEVLEHVEDWRGMTREMGRLSARYLMVSFPAGRMRPFERNVGHLRNFRRGQFERFAASIGFEPVAVFYAGFPFYSPLFRDVCNIVNSGGNSLTIGRYSWWQKRAGDVLYFFFRFLSMKRRGSQFCGLFARATPSSSV